MREYTLAVPIMMATLEDYGYEKYISELKKSGAQRVFLCPLSGSKFWDNYDEQLALYRKYVKIMKSEGFEVGVWVWAFQYEGSSYTYMKNPKGVDSRTSVCPTDKDYRDKMGRFIEDAAATGIDLFMFDDDYRYSFIDNGLCCCCENHMKMISDDLGEEVPFEIMEEKLLYGGKNKYREAFLRANGKALGEFALDMRRHIDKVNPNVRMGFCSCIGQWEMDGLHPDIIAKNMAGNTRPFYRLIGAPYWAPGQFWGNRLADIIEFERVEASRRLDDNIEIFSEGDNYPRPRYKTPAAYEEGFDTALRAAGCTNGILKYMIDYTSSPEMETMYIEKHASNTELYTEIEKMFSDKENTGIKVIDSQERYANVTIPKRMEGKFDIQDIAFSAGARMLTACSLPIVYGKKGYSSIAFGADAYAVTDEDLANGLILDLEACEILQKKGIDTGVRKIADRLDASIEIYSNPFNKVAPGAAFSCRETEVDDKAVIESRFECADKTVTGSYRYENAQGQRFLVFCFDGYFNNDGISRQYPRAKQIINAVPWLCGKELPAYITGQPDLYVQTKDNDKSLVVGLWNFCVDDIPAPIINLSYIPKDIHTINCSAVSDGKTIKLSRIEPFGFAAVELIK